MTEPQRLGVGVIGMGWMGNVHARSYLAASHRFPELNYKIDLVACSDANAQLGEQGQRRFGFTRLESDWRKLIDDSSIDVVSITTPNFLHAEICEAAAAAGKHIWCEKPVGRNCADSARAADAAARAQVATMAGFNYHWAPMVQHVRQLLDDGTLGPVEMFRGRFYSMYAFDRLALHSWRFEQGKAGSGAVGDLLSHVIDMALQLVGPITKVCAHTHVFVAERPIPQGGGVSHYARGKPGDPTAKVENEDFAGALVKFASGALGVVEGWRTACGPQADMGFELYCQNGSVRWSFEDMNSLEIFLRDRVPLEGYTRVLAGAAHPDHSRFNPGDGIALGYEDTKAIEAARLLESISNGAVGRALGLQRASEVADIGDAVLRAAAGNSWVDVTNSRTVTNS